MDVSLEELLDTFREASITTRQQGTLLEELFAEYLRVDPVYQDRFSDVWLWDEWPDSEGKPDTGIDIVARERETGEYAAIQCKFYDPKSTLNKSDIDSFFTASGKSPFTSRMIVSTTDKWSKHAEDALTGQHIPVKRVGVGDLIESGVDWGSLVTSPGGVSLEGPSQKQPRKHQRDAIAAVREGFTQHDRGRLIMACGTGKTFTSLKLAEEIARDNTEDSTYVLFMVPSISLLAQSLREWSAQKEIPISSFAVCSDAQVTRTNEDIRVEDLAFPATTDPKRLVQMLNKSEDYWAKTGSNEKRLVVVFSTYQSIEVIHEAQKQGLPAFDLVICDEAHRTTGYKTENKEESHFVRIHDNDYVEASKRLYMTATPRLFAETAKAKADKSDAVVWSMDNEEYFGPEFHRLGFGEAVDKGLLTDYKVLILTVDEELIDSTMQESFGEDYEIPLNDAVKMVGCWNGLAKRSAEFADGSTGFGTDTAPMQRAVAFNATISDSKKVTDKFNDVIGAYTDAHEGTLATEVQHVDGSYNAVQRTNLLEWLKEPTPHNTCRILSNARCLSEGIDVPALDAVMFLNPRNSQVDVVQAVGRVMRKTDDKQYGYIILPVGIPAGKRPEEALRDNKKYKVIWQVLQALRAHDDRFNAMINKIDLNKKKPDQIIVAPVTTGPDGKPAIPAAPQPEDAIGETTTTADVVDLDTSTAVTDTISQQLALVPVDEWRNSIYSKVVEKVGERTYWEQWAKDVSEIYNSHVHRITQLIATDAHKAAAFEEFLTELQAIINPAVDQANAIDMLAQHIITKPVFNALFDGYEFTDNNPVSLTMQKMLDTLEDTTLTREDDTLTKFYDSVRKRAEGIDNHEGRQKVITELYENFFKQALPKTADAFGIVYTPLEVVDFILRAANQALDKHFGAALTEKGVQILDPFTGTGTFIVRLLQTGLIKPEDLERKYLSELHANEILLLAYYIAAVNIEAAYHEARAEQGDTDTYRPFDGIVLTDTFQLAENPSSLEAELFPENNERLKKQKELDITVIVGNPPYSAGQDSANDNNQNLKYPVLDKRIDNSYAKHSSARLKVSLYDSYIRAIRWASDRIGDEGIICYVSNGGYIDSNSADGIRKTLADEFTDIYCYNLRGNARTAGELRRKEGGNVFGGGSRSTVAILLLVKKASTEIPGNIHYRDIGDYLTREQKLATLAKEDLTTVPWETITPNQHHDWINQRDENYGNYRILGHKPKKNEHIEATIFTLYSSGLKTNRDAWVYNYSRTEVVENVQRMIREYDSQLNRMREAALSEPGVSRKEVFKNEINKDSTDISWDGSLEQSLVRLQEVNYESDSIRIGAYRPFTKQHVYFNRALNNSTYKLRELFPTPEHENYGFYVNGFHATSTFALLAMNSIPCLDIFGKGGQFFPRWSYEKVDTELGDQGDLLASADAEEGGYRKIDNITDSSLADYKEAFGSDVTKDDVFYYVYGLLHSQEYREKYAADLKKTLPRIPKVKGFREFSEAGRKLADLHIDYESVEPYHLDEAWGFSENLSDNEKYRVKKMVINKKDPSTLQYNDYLTLSGIPEDAYRYELGARSALAWIVERYQVKTDKASGIVNDPNDWCTEVGNPAYIVDLIKRITTVSIETMKIVDSLPPLEVSE